MMIEGREYKGYIMVSVDDLQNEKEFEFWINLALVYNKTLSAAPNPARKRKK